MGKLAGKVALVTGGSRGLGAATARALAELGAAVALTARGIEGCHEVAGTITDTGGKAIALACDVADYASTAAAVAAILEQLGGVDILINNAGVIDPEDTIEDSDPAQWDDNIRINLVGAFNATHAVLPHMRARGGGAIVNVSSGAAHRPVFGWSAYCAGTAGLAMLTRSIDLEFGEHGIRAYGFSPGVTQTDMQVKIRERKVNRVSDIPWDDLSPPQRPARIMAWLCTDDAADLAGQELVIDDDALRRRAGLSD